MAKELDRFEEHPKKNISLKTKLIAMIAGASIIGVAVTGTMALTVFDKGLLNQTIEELEHTTSGIEWILEDWLDTLGGYGDMLASTDHIKGYLDGSYKDDPNAYLKEKGEICSVDLLAITDTSGKVVSGYKAAKNYTTNLSIVKSALAGRTAYAYGPFGEIKYGLIYACPVIKNGEKLGALVIGYDLSTQGSDGYVSIVNNHYAVECTVFDGKVRAATTLGNHMVGTEASGLFGWNN